MGRWVFAVPVPGGGAYLFGRLPTLPLVLLLPIPPTPFPGGEGGDSRLFHARGSAPCIPGAEPARHWERGRTTRPAGDLPRRCRLTLPLWYSQGGAPSLSPADPAFSLLFCPLSPLPPSPAGKGETKVISCKGLRPLHPRDKTRAALGKGTNHAPGGGGLTCLSPACPAFCFPFCPLSPPPPSPVGKGEIQGYCMQGASPLASPGLNPRGTGKGGRTTRPAGGLPPALPVDLAAVVLAGGLIFLVACLPCL